jgi:hypothetical protein
MLRLLGSCMLARDIGYQTNIRRDLPRFGALNEVKPLLLLGWSWAWFLARSSSASTGKGLGMKTSTWPPALAPSCSRLTLSKPYAHRDQACMRSFTTSEQARNATVKGIIKIRENLLHDTVIFWYLLKYTARLCICQVPLQFCDTFARTHHQPKTESFTLLPCGLVLKTK